MKPAAGHSVAFGAVALTTGFVAGAALLISAGGLQWTLEICRSMSSNDANESPFLTENGDAMTKMMNDMTVEPTGDVDADFVAMMVPHHQGAIEMARAVLRYGRNAQIKRLAQEIIVTQQQEIAVMRLAVGEPLPPSVPSPTQVAARLGLNTR
jgi:Domain of unknown function (DUF305)